MKRQEKEARIKCIDDGMDPDFVGQKGYPNWMDFTDKSIQKIKNLINELKSISS